MAKVFDGSSKELIAFDPEAWARFSNLVPPDAKVEVYNNDLSAITPSVDSAFTIRPKTADPWILIEEFQAQYDSGLPLTSFVREAIVRSRNPDTKVNTVIIYAVEAAISKLQATGRLELPREAGEPMIYPYTVIKLWEIPPEHFLSGGLGLIPLAPLGKVELPDVGQVLVDIQKQIEPESISTKNKIWDTTFLLMGLKYQDIDAIQLLRQVTNMEASSTFRYAKNQGIEEMRPQLEQARLEAAQAQQRAEQAEQQTRNILRQILLQTCVSRFGANLPTDINTRIDNQNDIEILRSATSLSLTATTFDEVAEVLKAPQ